MHTLYVTNLTFVVLLAHQEYLYSNHYWNKSLITQWVLYITNECVNKDKKVELYVVEKGKMPNSLSKIRRVFNKLTKLNIQFLKRGENIYRETIFF